MNGASPPSELPGLGLDLVEVQRFREALERGGDKFRDRLFTGAEQADCEGRADPAPHYAARFAAKEAAMKALGTGWTGGIAFRDFEVEPTEGRQAPRLRLSGKAAEFASKRRLRGLKVSLTHTETTAGAVVFVVDGN